MDKANFYEIIRFCLVGGGSFLVDYSLLYFCTEYIGMNYLYSSAVSFTVSVIVNYWLCVKFVFPGAGRQGKKQVTLFVGSSIVGLGLNQLCMWVLVEQFALYYMIAKIAATIVVTVWNYIMKRKAVRG